MNGVDWAVLYRGRLSSCNYACDYCPFAKTHNNAAELREDASQLRRFIDWVEGRSERIGVLFTPWGEALVHSHYQRAMCELSNLPNVRRIAIQTNLSGRLDWLSQANPETVALWCTFHPTQTSVEAFRTQCRRLDALGIRYSAGMVGTHENLAHLNTLRGELRQGIYLWVNAIKRDPDYYNQAEIDFISGIDPLFPFNNRHHPSLNRRCRTGHTVFTVDGNGDMRRCHFVKTVIGNIYQPGFESSLVPRLCPAQTCGCHIGYVHLEELGLDKVYGDGLLERIPSSRRFTI